MLYGIVSLAVIIAMWGLANLLLETLLGGTFQIQSVTYLKKNTPRSGGVFYIVNTIW